jgi:hypothetical protein
MHSETIKKDKNDRLFDKHGVYFGSQIHMKDILYLLNDKESRLKLLEGIIDADGYYNEKMKKFELTHKSKVLIQHINSSKIMN